MYVINADGLKRKGKRVMKKTIRILCSLVCLMSLVALVFTSCNFGTPTQNTTPTDGTTEGNSPTVTTPSETTNNDPPIDSQGKQIPVYQGMSISTSATMPSFEKEGNNGNGKENGNTDNNGNHNGWYKGDSVEDQEDVDQNQPFPDTNENIEEEIKTSLEVIGSKQDIYYAAQNQDIYIYIYIDNPDQFEILSFTLNGQKYSSYMFEKGSTQELLILEYNVGNVSGVVEYTIDQIKYIDGTEIKDVKIGGDKTVRAGVRTEDQVIANVTNVQIGTNSVSFDATISDKDGLIAYSQGNVKAILYDGDILVAEKELSVGSNSVAFDSLKTGTVYQYAIVASYDAFDDNGIALHVLYKYAFQTNYVVLFDNIVIGQENINFTFAWDASVANKVLTGMKLYKGGQLVKELNTDATTVSELLSANEYVLVAEYQNLGKTETISLTFGTLEKGVPGIFITNTTSTQTSVEFGVFEADTDNVGAITKIELVHKNGTVVADSLDQRVFANLLSNNTYTVKVTYTYDLNDGNGEQTIVKEREIKTLAKSVPQISVINPTQTQTSVGFEIEETDTDNVGSVTKIELVHKNGTVVADSLDQRVFANLLSNNTYTVKVTYTYDLNDGNGEQTIIKERELKTLAKPVPQISVANPTQTQTSVGFEIEETDNDNVGTVTKIELVHANGTVVADSLDQRTFANLLSNNTYTVKVTYAYDLNDGNGVQTLTAEANIKTLAKTAPQFVISNEKATSGNLTADYIFTDVDSVLASYKVELYNGETLVAQNIENKISFTDLEYLIDYTITITYTYDLNDGMGVQTATATKPFKMTSTGFAYTVNADRTTCTITGIGTCMDTEIYIPEIIDGYTVTVIGENAFKDCASITAIVFFDKEISISKRAFYGCMSLTEITIPETVNYIGEQAFFKCSNLSTVYYNSLYAPSRDTVFLNTASITKVVFNGDFVPANVCYGCGSLRTVEILENVKYIYSSAFEGCTSLTDVSFATTSLYLDGRYQFARCTNLETVVLPEGLTNLDLYMFEGCSKLKNITIPSTITYIADRPFWDCYALENVYISDLEAYCKIVYDNSFRDSCAMGFAKHLYLNGELIINLVIPDTVTKIPAHAFSSVDIQTVVIPDSVVSIGEYAFSDCSSLTSVTLPESVTTFASGIFHSCTALTNITFEGTVEEWNAINKGENWDSYSDNYAVYCTDGILCKNHAEVIDEGIAPTCTETGLTEGKHCSVCGEILVAKETVPAKGHHYGAWITIKVPTESEDGLQERLCACGKKETRTIDQKAFEIVETVIPKLSMFESVFQADSRGWCMYSDIMGEPFTEFLANQDSIIEVGANAEDVTLAGIATENLRVLLKGYNDLRTKKWDSDYEKYKALYQYYTDNYDALEQNFCDLYKCLKWLYENSVISGYIGVQGLTAHYRQFVGHLFVVSTALDQDEYRDEDAWRMGKETLREVIEDVHYFPDGNWYPEELQYLNR